MQEHFLWNKPWGKKSAISGLDKAGGISAVEDVGVSRLQNGFDGWG